MNSVGPVRPTGHYAMQESDSLSIFEDLNPLVPYTRESLRERGQLVVVSGEESPAAKLGRVVQVLDHSLGDRHAVVGRGPPPHLIQDHQRRSRRVVDDVR